MAALNGYYILPKPPPSSPSRRCCCFSSSPSTTFPRSSPPSSSSSSSGPFPLLTPKHHHHPSSSSSSALARRHHIYSGGGRSRTKRKIHCSCSSSETDVVELPLFPLPLVLFPGAVLPLQIFEFRYRILMHTLLQTDLRFGVVFSDSGSAAGVGCVAEVIKHEGLADDRFFLVCKGQERFRVTRIVRTKPYLVGEVLWLEDRPHQRRTTTDEGEEQDGAEDPESLASEVERHMRDVIRISNRLNGKKKKDEEAKKEEEEEEEEEEKEKKEKEKEEVSASMDLRKNLFPTPFSFFVGSTFEGAPREQQALLEMEDTVARLRRERDTLRNTLNYLTAASAVNDAFPSSSSS